ncbi:MAG: holo-ACP synthase [Gemmatimonadota bacterium]|jgi:holo-[acyl-carrier protein] synthase
MILGIGVDQVEVARIERLLGKRPERGAERLFTPAERTVCGSRRRPAECYAARFAAKEAFVKALGTGLREGMRWTEIEVRTHPDGRPEILLSGAAGRRFRERGGRRIHLSFTHEGGQAVALVVLEGAPGTPEADDFEGAGS